MSQVEHPSHYGGKDNVYETIKVLEARLSPEEFVGAMRFNIYKYCDRFNMKGGVKDLEKAQFYLNYLINYCKGRNLDWAEGRRVAVNPPPRPEPQAPFKKG